MTFNPNASHKATEAFVTFDSIDFHQVKLHQVLTLVEAYNNNNNN